MKSGIDVLVAIGRRHPQCRAKLHKDGVPVVVFLKLSIETCRNDYTLGFETSLK